MLATHSCTGLRTIDRNVCLCARSREQGGHHDRKVRFEFGSHSLTYLGPCGNEVVAQECITGINGTVWRHTISEDTKKYEEVSLWIRISSSTSVLASARKTSRPTAMAIRGQHETSSNG